MQRFMGFVHRHFVLCVATMLVALPSTVLAGEEEVTTPVDTSISEAQTSYTGARVLKAGVEIFGGFSGPGMYQTSALESYDIDYYAEWQGDTLFFGAKDVESGNTVDAVAEFFWFESSVPKSADHYVIVIKVKSAPNIVDDWVLSQEDGDWWTVWLHENPPCQTLSVEMGPEDSDGAIRWDWSVPFQNYEWDPVQTINIEQSYSGGYDLSASADANASGSQSFKEGGFLNDLTYGAQIQGKGYFNQSFSVSTQYTITLYKWRMIVNGGAQEMIWNLVVGEDGSVTNDSAYHEYFVVVQAPKGSTAYIDKIDIGAAFRDVNWLWFDGEQKLSMALSDIEFMPPVDIECYGSDTPPSAASLGCPTAGVCSGAIPFCAEGKWTCQQPKAYEANESSCDGQDNDCDGLVDEGLSKSCSSDCGAGTQSCVGGAWSSCSTDAAPETCDGVDNDCDGKVDESLEQACQTACGAGTKTCIDGGWSTCSATEAVAEVCDGLDNDCDGVADEDLSRKCETACGAGEEVCSGGAWVGCNAKQPEAEICGDAVDNDCNGLVDEETCTSTPGDGSVGTGGGNTPIYVAGGGQGGVGCSGGQGMAWGFALLMLFGLAIRRRSSFSL